MARPLPPVKGNTDRWASILYEELQDLRALITGSEVSAPEVPISEPLPQRHDVEQPEPEPPAEPEPDAEPEEPAKTTKRSRKAAPA